MFRCRHGLLLMTRIVNVLQKISSLDPDRNAFIFLEDGIRESEQITFAELDHRARIIGAYLQSKQMFGQRILLIFPAGLDFISCFLGCLYSGAIAVPVNCPQLNDFEMALEQLKVIAEDADIAGIFTISTYLEQTRKGFTKFNKAKQIFIEDINSINPAISANYALPVIRNDTIAYLQYTSGSTSTPKAAVITHENLIHSLKQTAKVWHYKKDSITLTWAPHSHVYGLICGLLVPLYNGSLGIIMSAAAFIHHPDRWLTAISKYKVTHSGCPNFGYETCINHIDENEITNIDLSCWKVAINGGENVKHETLTAFIKKFQPFGFKLQQFNSAYGMSEVTGAIAVSVYGAKPNEVYIDREALKDNKFILSKDANSQRIIITSGHLLPGLKAKIVNPESLSPAGVNEVGEIWLAGKSVVNEYWRRPEESKMVFSARLKNDKEKYFRTGDLGFVYKNEIAITGRLKEMIVINGKKYYPLDIENTIANTMQDNTTAGARVVFSTLIGNTEQVIVIQEIAESLDEKMQQTIVQNMRHAMTKYHGINVHEVILVKLKSLPKTASGKLQRKLAQTYYAENKLSVLNRHSSQTATKVSLDTSIDKAKDELNFIKIIAQVLNIDTDKIDLDAPLSQYQFDSINMIKLSSILNEAYNRDLSPAIFYEYATMREFYHARLFNNDTKVYQANSALRNNNHVNDVAIIGMSGVFPYANNVEEFWNNLIHGIDCISEIPNARWDWQAYYGDPQIETNKTNIKWGGFINGIDEFDAKFFNISPHEAELMDPQQRLFLTTTWKTIEDAGYSPRELAKLKTGLFVGAFNHDYAEILRNNGITDAYITTGLSHSIIANRISYIMDFHGPSEVIDTACSSSLVAIHHAVRAIQHGDCDIAIAGGVNALLTPTTYLSASKAGMLSIDGRCKTFDRNANGYVRSEGVAAILLKSLSAAITDNDHIYAVIKGTAINHGGHVNSLTAPNPIAQSDVIIAACENGDIDVDTIDYIEAHGTGTALGDPIEINGLKKAFELLAKKQNKKRLTEHQCGIGSVKTNIGHLESAAGIAGLIKVVLALQNEKIPGNLHFNELNPYIDFTSSPFYILDKHKTWPRVANKTRRAGISSFGFGGTNAHIIIEESPQSDQSKQRASLPAYQFAPEHYWINNQYANSANKCYSKIIHSNDSLIRDHVIQNENIVPATLFLDMACTAAKTANISKHVISLKDVIWYKPITMTAEQRNIELNLQQDALYTSFMVNDNKTTVNLCAEGKIVHQSIERINKRISIATIKSQLLKQLNQNQIYKNFASIGINYGKSFQVIEEIHYNETELLAKLATQQDIDATNFYINPYLLDGVLQTTNTLLNRQMLYLPFNIKQIDIYEPLPNNLYVYARLISTVETDLPRFDIQVCNDEGKVLVAINEFCLHRFSQQRQTNSDVFYYHPHWLKMPINEDNIARKKQDHVILVFDQDGETAEYLAQAHNQLMIKVKTGNSFQEIDKYNYVINSTVESDFKLLINCLYKNQLSPTYFIIKHCACFSDIPLHAEETLKFIFSLTKTLIHVVKHERIQIINLINSGCLTSTALAAFSKSLNLENPNIRSRVIEINNNANIYPELIRNDIEVRYDNQNYRTVKRYQEIRQTVPTTSKISIKPFGVYLITGGLGGLGSIIANYLAREFQANIVLAGRSSLNETQLQLMNNLQNLGGKIIYVKADISKQDQAESLINESINNFAKLDGIIHAAGITDDEFVFNKKLESVPNVLAPKINGSIYLDEATKDFNMDFFIMFSSVASIFGNAGQCDYSYANGFVDGFAIHRQQLVNKGRRFGKTISINWPLWKEGGMHIPAVAEEWLSNTLGIRSLTTAEGLRAFNASLQSNHDNVIVLSGVKSKLEHALQQRSSYHDIANVIEAENIESTEFSDQVHNYLREILSANAKIPAHQISLHDDFTNYGIDSIMIISLNHQLAKIFGDLPKTLFFEYKNLNELTQYFIKNHANTLMQKMDIQVSKEINTKKSNAMTIKSVKIYKRYMPENVNEHDVAIIGISGSYPDADDVLEYWENLKIGKNSITEIPKDRWNYDEYFDTNKSLAGKSYSKWGGFIRDVDKFDPLFFNISPREAEQMDPQERLFLQTAWKTIEDAGYSADDFANTNIGVYVGVMYGQYQLFGANDTDAVLTNSIFASIANRVSYFLNLHGPSLAIDTMCSSSLTAIHLACKSICDGESELALAGGVNLSIHPNKYLLLSQGNFLATDGQCHSFGEGGDGYVPGEGVGAVLLKSLSKALEDGDHIYAIIKGSSINHGGKTNGYTVPCPVAQAAVINSAYQHANIKPETISYIEAHGTGTSLGDPIEIAGLSKVFPSIDNQHSYVIGSVKSNIGHCESAAGIAALTKVVMQLQHKYLVPSLHSQILNSNINWDKVPFKVQQELQEWQRSKITVDGKQMEFRRRSGINSFGAGGANAHVIIEEAPDELQKNVAAKNQAYLFALSAKSKESLQQRISDLIAWIKTNELNLETKNIRLEDISYTLNVGRKHFEYRCIICANSLSELLQGLKSLLANEKTSHGYIRTEIVQFEDQSIFTSVITKLIDDIVNDGVNDQRKNLIALAKFYVNGCHIDWNNLYRHQDHNRISLPTYPFAKEYVWYKRDYVSDKVCVDTSYAHIEDSTNYHQICSAVENTISRILCEHLKLDLNKFDLTKNVSEYGVDSVTLVTIIKQINDFYHLDLSPALFYLHNNVKNLSAYLVSDFYDVVIKMHSNHVKTLEQPYAHCKQKSPESVSQQLNQDKIKSNAPLAIAIIGVQGVLPQSNDVNEFWQHLLAGDDLITEIPIERWNWRDYFGDIKQHKNKSNSRWGGFIKDVDKFDSAFFNISTREANLMDPQQRLFLEIAWKTIEDAGYDPLALSGAKIGVFAGVEFSEYQTLISNQQNEFHGYIATGNSHSMIPNRVSYFLNFHGPSEAIDTACSSSLVAIHRAVNAIRNNECTLALAGGVSLSINPDTVTITSQLGALSPDGHCKTFDKSANGYVKGEGVAAILLKPLNQAIADGDHIYGVIKGSAVNHGGKAQSLTAPNAAVQSDLLLDAYKQAAINPETISYIETHGTGTELGDPAEIEGLKLAFKKLLSQSKQQTRIGLGSVKTNIGHLEPASGIASVIKVLLAMRHEIIPANLHFTELNPFISLESTPFYIINKAQTWSRKTNANIRRAGISSFGFGGTIAHVILEEAPLQTLTNITNKPYYLITLSAKTKASLNQKLQDLYEWLLLNTTVAIQSLSCTLNMGRSHFEERCAMIVSSSMELLDLLNGVVNSKLNQQILYSDTAVKANGPIFDEIYKMTMTVLANYANVDGRLYREKLLLVADLYLKYYPIEWPALHVDENFQRIAGLPIYPFTKTKHWFDIVGSNVNAMQQIVHTSETVSPALDLKASTLAYLQQIFADKLRISPAQIAFDQTYEVYGVDSITGLEITNRLEDDFNTLPKTLLYERNHLNDLAAYFQKYHLNTLHSLFKVNNLTDVNANAVPDTNSSTIKNEFQITPNSLTEDIAIIGLSGIYPQAKDINQFWENLVVGRDCVGEVPIERWNYKDYPVNVGGEKKYFKHGGFIDDIDKFDTLFFNISPHDAALMDPQERLFMQSVWTTLEDAGYTREKLRQIANNEVGVFVGATYNYYPVFIAEEWQKDNRVPLDIQMFSLANRISYFLNATGPSYVIDTACSSSLAAIHLACESILRGACKMAIAGGVNLSLHPSKYHFLGSFNFMSEQGRCTSFAEGGTGYVPSEGVGSVLLKPLSLAIRDNDRIYGVIKSSAMNHGGKTSGYTVPNPVGQANVIKMALNKAQIDPRTINYIEAHGTGTSLGDPIEVRGLEEAFSNYTQDKQFCAIGSVKSNIGHCESAAGISQLTKVLLQMQHKKLVASLHAEKLNPYINFADTPFYVQRELADWTTNNNQLRRAGISSFGAGGANVHLIVEEYIPGVKPRNSFSLPLIFLLSAFNQDRLLEYASRMYDFIARKATQVTQEWIEDVCYTTQTGRENLSARLAIMGSSAQDILNKLQDYLEQPAQAQSGIFISQNPQQANLDIMQMMNTGKYAELVQSWVNGATIPWKNLYANAERQCIKLPTYPFAKRRCWIATKTVEETKPIEATKPMETQPIAIEPNLLEVDEWLYQTKWYQSNDATQHEKHFDPESRWLIFSDKELGFALQNELGRDNCIYCFSGDSFNKLEKNIYYINLESAEDYVQLFKNIHADYKQNLQGIIYLCPSSQANVADAISAMTASLQLTNLFQALIKHDWRNEMLFCLITRGSQTVTNEDKMTQWLHHLWSLTRIFAVEHSRYQALLLDLDSKVNLNADAKIISQEILSYSPEKNHLAYRNNTQYSLRLSRYSNTTAAIKTSDHPLSVLVTGGAGALGLEVAKWFVKQGTKYLLLTGSTRLPERNDWNNVSDDAIKDKINGIIELEKYGAQVIYAAIDVADKDKMQDCINEFETLTQQKIGGVCHLAGVTTDNIPIQKITADTLATVLKVKITGSIVLHELFKDHKLSCFILFSSIAAVPYFGMSGLSAYAMANEFMDGLAAYRQQHGLVATSINWVAWAEKGMSYRYNHGKFLDAVGMCELSVAHGIELLKHILSQQPPTVIVTKIFWDKFLQVNSTAKNLDFFKDFSHYAINKANRSNHSGLNQQQILLLLINIFAKSFQLNFDEIDANMVFQNYGMDSILGIKFITDLSEHFPDVLTAMDLYRYPTLNKLAEFIFSATQASSTSEDISNESAQFTDDILMTEISQLSDDTVTMLLENELKELELHG